MTSADQGTDEAPSPQALQIKEEPHDHGHESAEEQHLGGERLEAMTVEDSNGHHPTTHNDQPLDFSHHRDELPGDVRTREDMRDQDEMQNHDDIDDDDNGMPIKGSMSPTERKISQDSGICMQPMTNGHHVVGAPSPSYADCGDNHPESRSITPNSVTDENIRPQVPGMLSASDPRHAAAHMPHGAAAAAAASLLPGLFPGLPGMPGLSAGAAASMWPSMMNPHWMAMVQEQRLLYGGATAAGHFPKLPNMNGTPPSGLNGKNGNSARPFKAYPKDPLSLPIPYPYGVPGMSAFGPGSAVDPVAVSSAAAIKTQSEEFYSVYRRNVLRQQEELKRGKDSGKQSSAAAAAAAAAVLANMEGTNGNGSHASSVGTVNKSSRSNSLGSRPSNSPHVLPNGSLTSSAVLSLHQPELRNSSNGSSSCNSSVGSGTGNGNHSHALNSASMIDTGAGSFSTTDSTHAGSPATAQPTKRRRTGTGGSTSGGNLADEQKDAAYWERRKKNNEAAKRSRDARRAKEDEIAIRAAYLEQENVRLKMELSALRAEVTKLRACLVPK